MKTSIMLACAAVLLAQATHTTPFTGTWKLNLDKSQFSPGPPFKAFSLTFGPDGVRKLDLTYADGRTLQVSVPWSDGKEVAVTAGPGFENVTVVSRIQGKTLNDTWTRNGKLFETVHAAISPDGKSLMIRVAGTDAQDRAFQNQLTFDKQ